MYVYFIFNLVFISEKNEYKYFTWVSANVQRLRREDLHQSSWSLIWSWIWGWTGLQRSHCSRRVRLSVHTTVLKWNECEPWSLRRQDSLHDFLNKTLQCSFSPMISVYMWTTGHQQLLLTSHEERLQMYLPIIDSVHFKTFSVAFVCRRKYMTSSALILISKVFSEMYWNMTNKDVFVKNITVVVWKTIFCSI